MVITCHTCGGAVARAKSKHYESECGQCGAITWFGYGQGLMVQISDPTPGPRYPGKGHRYDTSQGDQCLDCGWSVYEGPWDCSGSAPDAVAPTPCHLSPAEKQAILAQISDTPPPRPLSGWYDGPWDCSRTAPVAKSPACECGAAKASGVANYGPGHSSWCPVAKSEP